MTRKHQIRVRTNWQKSGLPVKKPPCPVCMTIERIWPTPLVKTIVVRLKRRGSSTRCPKCKTWFSAQTKDNKTRWRYEASSIGRLAKEQLANYWMGTHEGDPPKVLAIKPEEGPYN